jgi:hypothetical protein
MKQKKMSLGVFLLLGMGLSQGFAQQAVTSSGGDASGSGGTAAYSVGQVAYTSNQSANGSVNQGVQQAYEIFTIGLDDKVLSENSFSLYPNPVSNELKLQSGGFEKEILHYSLLDVQGKLISTSEVKENETIIPVSQLPSATYFIHLINQENKKVQSFKIIKTN